MLFKKVVAKTNVIGVTSTEWQEDRIAAPATNPHRNAFNAFMETKICLLTTTAWTGPCSTARRRHDHEFPVETAACNATGE
jgi:hypothetical protein